MLTYSNTFLRIMNYVINESNYTTNLMLFKKSSFLIWIIFQILLLLVFF